ncbi:MAG: aminoglycoside phosphotransferase family protein [bacterium]|nr:aminoglycoside phosphotransferase family protein [bacterium]
MKNYLSRIKKIKKELTILQGENFETAPSGTHYKVFLSNGYVVRFRDDNPKLLLREANFLKQISHPLIPKVLWIGKIGKSIAMVENRLPGKTINMVWKTLPKINQRNIIKQIIEFIQYLKTQTRDYVYSVNTGRKHRNFPDYLTDAIKQKVARIKKFKQTGGILKNLLSVIEKSEIKNLFSKRKRTTLVHGDLIIHNLLTDGKNLTGVLDWELSLFGDPDYDLSRLFYYQECAKAYQEQGIDETFESDFMDKLITVILKSNLLQDKKLFPRKYQFMRAVFYLNALYWAANSDSPEKNLNELIIQWDKKREVKYLRT